MASRDKQGPPVVLGRTQQSNVQTNGKLMDQRTYVGSLKRVGNHL